MRPMATIEREALVTLTESAATKVKKLMAEEPEGEATVLRVAVLYTRVRKELERDGTLQTGIERLVDDAHAAGAEHFEDFVV
mgnify:CR=1 FL=1